MGQLQEVINAIVKETVVLSHWKRADLLNYYKMAVTVSVSSAVVFSQKLTHRIGLIFLNICLLLF